ncbi:CbiX/SirB N-terminal domain-containing protein [Desulfoscipio sp. XC116]|uniref:CbiX/SirB N-terminal domain-containing protein n=1 Tax=Desulfoscipio sp. XC116 TaxID=3144975 RepID=UPI00325AC31B
MFRSGVKGLAVVLLLFMAVLSVVPFCGAAEENIGVLVVAHGSDETFWNDDVQQAVEEVSLSYPVELGFLEFAEPNIHDAVAALEARGVDRIIAVPLFISSYSNHIEEIKYVLGLRPDLPEAEESAGGHPGGGGGDTEEEELTPVDTEVEIVLTPAMDDNVMVAGILADRLETISENPGNEVAVLVGHGSDTEEGRHKSRETFASLAGYLKDLLGLKDAGYGFALMGEPTVRDSVYEAVYQGDVLVVPVMLSEGYFTDTVIPHNLLNGLDYRYPGAGNRALLPHSNIARFIELRVNDVVLPPLEIKTGGEISRINYTDVAVEPDGKICICGSFAFRAMQVALAELWPGEIPERDRIYVEGPYSHGVEDALETIAGTGNFTLEQREHSNLFYNFKVTDKLSGQAVNITVKPEVYPENFFELKKKVKDGTATAEEMREFQAKRAQLVEKVRWGSPDQLFTLETAQINSTGILVLAHGSSDDDWNQPVRDAVKNIRGPFPVEYGFLEPVPGEDISTAVRKLEAQGVKRIIAVPIFVASASGHIEEIKFMLGLPSSITAEEAAEEGLEPVQCSADIELTSALDEHLLVAGILNDRIASVSRQADQEVVVLVAHGTSSAQDLAVWKYNLASLGQKLQKEHGFWEVDYGFAAVGEPGLRSVVMAQQAAHPDASVIIVPVMLSEGAFTNNKIPSVLEGLEYVYPAAGQRSLLPHDNISHLIAARANDVVLGSLQVKQNGNTRTIAYSDVGVEEDGVVCVCGSFAFRAMQAALTELWPGAIPEQDRIYVEGPYSDGVEEALGTIVGTANFTLEQREQNNLFYNFKVTDQHSRKAVNITVKPEVYPENFFELKKKVKDGTATAEEKQKFQAKRAQLVEKLRWDSPEQVFTVKTINPSGGGGGSSSGGASSASSVTGRSKNIKAATGGSVTYGQTTVKIAAGVLPGDAVISVEKLSSADLKKLVSEGLRVKLGSDIYEVATSGRCDFGGKTVTICIAYDQAKIAAGEQPVIRYYDEEAGKWVNLPTIVEQGTDGKWYAVTQVNHLTKFAVFSEEEKKMEENKAKEKKVIILTIGQTTATVGGNTYTLDAAPCVDTKAGRTLVPIRFVSEALGAQTDWNPETQQVTIKDGDREIVLTLGSAKVLIDGQAKSIDSAPAVLASGRTFVPLRFVSETLGTNVDYDAATKQITIMY